MSHRLWLDIETYSTVDLRKSSPYRYVEDPEFRILLASYSFNGHTVRDVEGHDRVMRELADAVSDPDVVKVAHNATFERVCFSSALDLSVGTYLPPEEWHDTQAIAGAYGWPQKLERLAKVLKVSEKDAAGTSLINWFCKPDPKTGQPRRPEDHPEKWRMFVDYCHQDVVTLIEVDKALPSDFPTLVERANYFGSEWVNDNGLLIDVPMARRAWEEAQLNSAEQEAELSEITGLAKPGNTVKLREWFRTQGIGMRDMTAETVEEKLAKLNAREEGATPRRKALELRQELALTAPKKFPAALTQVNSDDRIRGAFRYFGAHTGRWSGSGAQPQNLPRHTFGPDADALEAMEELKEIGFTKDEVEAYGDAAAVRVTDDTIAGMMNGERVNADNLKRMVRPMFIGRPGLTVVDYSSIEAVVIAWLADEEWAMAAFREGRDIYVETAERMGGLTRPQGKIAVLALGFAGGVGSLRNMAGPKDDFINDQSDEEIRNTLVTPWRKANRRIAKLWLDLDEGFGRNTDIGQLLKARVGKDTMGRVVELQLPSGRGIRYHGAKFESYRIPVEKIKQFLDEETGKVRSRVVTEWIEKRGWRYANPKKPGRIGTYGGRLAENVTQGTARDITAEAIVRLNKAGMKVVGHVHDEILVDGSNDPAEVEGIMTVPPEWADGLPISGDGFRCTRYRKG